MVLDCQEPAFIKNPDISSSSVGGVINMSKFVTIFSIKMVK